MKYITMNANQKKFFVLFHGTGGNEYSLLSVTGDLDPEASIISFLGEIGSGRSRRYFPPLVNGQLPRADFGKEVDAFLALWETVKPADSDVTFIGYSNGANFILGLLEKQPTIAQKVVLLHPSNLNYHFSESADTTIILTSGASDTISIPGEVRLLSKQLEKHFPNTHTILVDSGHEISDDEIARVNQLLD